MPRTKTHPQGEKQGFGAIIKFGLHSLVFRISVILLIMVLCSIAMVSSLSYFELSKATNDNARARIDRAAHAAVTILATGTNNVFEPIFDSQGNPLALKSKSEELPFSNIAKLTRLVTVIGDTNQGNTRLFQWSETTRSFKPIAPGTQTVDGEEASAVALNRYHPAFANLSKGVPFVGDVPVADHLRLAYLTPILSDKRQVIGAIEVDVGSMDDLSAAESRLQTRILSAAFVIIVGAVLAGFLLLRRELTPLRQLAKTADELASGMQPTLVPFADRQDEIGDLAHGLERVTDLQDKLHKLAYIDQVTTAGNRARYFADLNDALKRSRSGNFGASLLHLDFNGFSKINDTFGQQVGNRVLLQAYVRLANVFGPSAQIARISADDFCILLPYDSDGATAECCTKRALELLSAPFKLDEAEIRVEPSIGIALLPRDAEDAETAHRVAGLALRAAKATDGSGYAFFAARFNERIQTEMLMETLLRAALKTRKLVLHYQPQICPRTRTLTGLEALIRWPSEKRGFIPPSEFIPIAEKTGLILDLGQYVLEEACKQAARWTKSGFDFNQVSVNVSPLQFRQPNFAENVKSILEWYELPANRLCLEVTENVFVDTSEQSVHDILSKLQKIGVQLSLDDFGSGYSSLIYLHRLPFKELKIDRAFLCDADRSPQKGQLFQAIIGLGRSLGLRVIAEGAETDGELALAAALGCDSVQGFYFSAAVPAEDLRDRLQEITGTSGRKVVAGRNSPA
ncbi:putative bifunctional diguanylate cyclase/phosphodiesterase [Roseibium sp. SCP14]|uniref:putative bifunctional diguanylate cyclase/phosphodiesterase n=1 Tax=Roseibium sp. SCP14 TaxID=3141375 RepID=UPI00333D594E